MIKAIIGDLFESKAQALVNTVNCVGVMGKGIAEQFKIHFPKMFEDYKLRCEHKSVRLGEPYLYRDMAGVCIINFPTKDHWRSPSRLADIEVGLDYLASHLEAWGISSVAMPPLGCGNGGLDWADVGPLIYRKLHELPVQIDIYAPYTTPRFQLTAEFLSSPTQMSFDDSGRNVEKLNPDWVVLLEVLRDLQSQPYANPVGRVIFQKICYVVTEMGVPTGFSFGKGSYGPFSGDVKAALHELANRNWLQEQPLGRMLTLRVGDSYTKDRSKFQGTIDRHQKKIDKTVDLFSRIKNTEQAEEVITVLYASRQVKRNAGHDDVAEQQIFDFILAWKKAWASEDKRVAVANAIRNLVVLGWMRARISDSMIEA